MSLFALDIIVRASALLAAAALGDLVLRRRASAATRHLLWTLAHRRAARAADRVVRPPGMDRADSDRAAVRAVASPLGVRRPARGDLGSDPTRDPLVTDSNGLQWIPSGEKTGGLTPIRQRGRPHGRA